MTYITAFREGGKYAIETYCEVAQTEPHGRFEKVTCAVVYGDKNLPSHSVRIFLWKDRDPNDGVQP